MKRLLLCLLLACFAPLGFALTPYLLGTKLAPADIPTQLAAVETKLKEAGFTSWDDTHPRGWRKVPAW